MARLLLLLGLCAIFGCGRKVTAGPLAKPEMWIVKNGSTDDVVFLANSTFQLHVTYNVTNDSTKTQIVSFTMDANSYSASSKDNTTFVVKIANATKNQSLEMTFTQDKTSYWMSDFTVKFRFNATLFPDAIDKDENITATAKINNAFMSKLGTSYKCSLDTQLQLQANSKAKLMTWFQMNGLQLEAFKNSSTFSADAPCFTDQAHTPTKETWTFQKVKYSCARITTAASIEVNYLQISGKKRKATIPLPADANAAATTCVLDKKVTAEMIFESNDISLAFIFEATETKASPQNYALTTVTLKYNTTNRYFPNSKDYSTELTFTNTSLSYASIPMNTSYLCSLEEEITVVSDMSLKLNDTQWQAFGEVPLKGFNNATECTAMTTTVPPPVTTPHPDPLQPSSYNWDATNGNTTCFLATLGFQFRANYMKSGENTTSSIWFDFNNKTSHISSTDCSNDTVTVTIEDKGKTSQRNQTIMMTFSKRENKTKYALTEVKIEFDVLNTTFINASSLGMMVSATSDEKLVLMETELKHSYTCTMETLVRVTGNESTANISNIYLRIFNVTDMEPFPENGKLSGEQSKCYHDQKKPDVKRGDWKVKNAKNETCTRVQSMFTLVVAYLDIADKIQFTSIPVEGDKVSVLDSSCDNSTTMLTLDIDQTKMINLTLTYKKVPSKYYASTAASDDYVLDNLTLSYRSDNWNFPNHKSYGKIIKITSNSSLMLLPTTVGKSYQCDLSQKYSVGSSQSNNMTIMMSQTRWQAFSFNKSGEFNEARFCAEEVSTTAPETTTPVTPQPHIPSDPQIAKRLVKSSDNKTVCLLAHIGVQLRMNYNSTKKPYLADIGFNMNPNETTTTGECNSNYSKITFHNTHDQQMVVLTFVKDSKNSYLSEVAVKYNISSLYPNVNTTVMAKNYSFSVMNLTELSTPNNSSYACTDEADVLVDMGSNVILRITGVLVQAFDVKKDNYSLAYRCLPETLPKTANTGNWTIMSNKSACARYMFAATFNITYPTLLGDKKSMVLPVGNSTKNAQGECGDVVSYFWVQQEQVNFTFVFNKTDVSGGTFNYHMWAVLVNYELPSKLFPNHAYDPDNKVQVVNASLDLFSSRNDRSYKCAKAAKTTLTAEATVEFKNVQVQPFGIPKSGGFSAAEDCDSDLSPIIPIIVGSVLAFLVVLVVAAYFVGRKRAARVEYDAI